MSKFFIEKLRFLMLATLFLAGTSYAMAQVEISGSIKDSKTGEAMVGVSVSVQGKVIGTISDTKGNFKLTTNTQPPFTLVFSSVGYQSQELEITGSRSNIDISLVEQSILGQEIVVSASRIAESEMRSPVTVEKVDIRTIRETTSSNFYDAMGELKGINLTTQGLLFKSINMRGFGSTGNPRIVQLIDGMDNMSPALNFAVDNIVGLPELDVESVEVLPGAASALYGPNAINGLILMNSKSPFLYQGLSANIKTGVMHDKERDVATTPFYDASIRYAKAFNDKVAFKVNLAYLTAKDWQARNYTNLNTGGLETGLRGPGVSLDYDGMNVYGDEVRANMKEVASQMAAGGLIPAAYVDMVPNVNISRTGFREMDMVNPETHSFKTNLALHIRPTEKMELIGQYNFGNGTTLYTGNGRYSLKDFQINQAKLELRGDNFNVRAYRTWEHSGNSATLGLSAVQMLNQIKPHGTWFGEYVGGYLGALGQGASGDDAHLAARALADQGMPTGQALKDMTTSFLETPIINGGGGFLDKSSLNHLEAFYNFKNEIKFIDLIIGGNYRMTHLKSEGTLFNDRGEGRSGVIPISEFGAYAQASKSLFNDYFKLVGSFRYDKHQNFDPQYSPRLSGIFTFGDNNIRLSYQTGFRIPTNQNQYINLRTAGGTLVGGLPEFDRISEYNLSGGITKYTLDQFSAKGLNYFDAATQASILKKAQDHGTQLITGQVSQAVADAVNANRPQIVAGVTAVVQDQVTATVSAAVLEQVRPLVTAGVQQQVTLEVTAGVDAAIAAGQLSEAMREAAIQQGIATQMASEQVKAIIEQNVAAKAGPIIESNVAEQMASSQIQAIIAQNVEAQAAGLIQSNIAAQLPGALAANLPGVTAQLAPAYGVAALPKYQARKLKPERITSYEIGYKGLIAKRLFVDAYYYYSLYKDFIGGTTIVVPTAPSSAVPGLPIESGIGSGNYNGFSRSSNTEKQITVDGWAAALNYSFDKGFNAGVNITHNKLKGFEESPEQQYAGFNSPEYTYNISFGKRLGSGETFGFNINLRHQTEFKWEGGLQAPTNTSVVYFTNTLVPAITNLDAQMSFKLAPIKSILKVGGNNIGSKAYFQAFGSAMVGSTYYVSLTFDELFNR